MIRFDEQRYFAEEVRILLVHRYGVTVGEPQDEPALEAQLAEAWRVGCGIAQTALAIACQRDRALLVRQDDRGATSLVRRLRLGADGRRVA